MAESGVCACAHDCVGLSVMVQECRMCVCGGVCVLSVWYTCAEWYM